MLNSKDFIHAKHVILNLFQDLLGMNAFIKIFVFGFFICFIAEGIGIIPKNITFSLFLLFAFCLLVPRSFSEVGSLIALRSKTFFVSNTWIFIGAFVYLLYLFYISGFSLNRQVSFEFIVFLFSLFLLFVVISRQWEAIEQPFLYSLLGLGVVFCIYSLLLPIALSNNLFQFYPQSGYQYVYSLFGNHNHLGDFLVFSLLISFNFYIQQKKKIFLGLFLFYFVFFLFSYSRSAYMGFFVGFLLLCISYRHELANRQKKLLTGFVVGFIFFFLLLSSNVLQSSTFRSFYEMMHIIPSQKSVIEIRKEYVLQGLKGFLTYRYYGVGLSNFEYVSKMFSEMPGGWTASSHNIFMDVLVETGTLSFVVFVIFTILLLKTIKKYHTSIFAVLLLSWFVMAQFDYIHQMYSYLLLFPLFLVGMLYSHRHSGERSDSRINLVIASEAKQSLRQSRMIIISLCLFLFIFLVMYILSNIFLYQGNYKLSRAIYPLQKAAYEPELHKKEVLDKYVQLFPGEYTGFYNLGKLYDKEGIMPKAIENYEKAFWLDPFRDLPMAEKIYNFKLKYEDSKSAKRFADKVFTRLNNDTEKQVLGYDYWLFINKFCQKVYNLHCPYTLQ